MDPSDQKPNQQQSDLLTPISNQYVAVRQEEMLQLITSAHLSGKEMGEMSERINILSVKNNELREKLKTFKKDNEAMNQEIGSLQNRNQKQEVTIRDLESSQEKLQKELENVKAAKEQLRIEFDKKTSELSTKNEKLTKKLEDMTKKFEAVEKENKELKRSLEELKNSNDSLKKTVDSISEKLEQKEARLQLGQVAWLMEAEIWKAVLPDKEMGKSGILQSMERWLSVKRSSREGKAAQKRWDDLKGKLNWNEEDHKYALKQLRKLRLEDAHPVNVDLDVARKQAKEGNYLASTDKELCEEIIDMIVAARKLNSSM
jgi:chromosome segregation ATPase